MELGVNLDPRHGFPALLAKDAGCTWVRFVLTADYDGTGFIEDCHAHRLRCLGVIARESLRRESYRMSFKTAARWYGAIYGDHLDALQIGNECDQHGVASWTMRQSTLDRLMRAVATEFAGTTTKLIGPGLASGRPAYLDRVPLSVIDAIAVHPYGQRADGVGPDWYAGEVRALVSAYHHFALPIWVTEFGAPAGDFGAGEHERAVYHTHMIRVLAGIGVATAFVFCYSDAMVDGFGLVGVDGVPKETFAAVSGAQLE